MKHMVNTRNTGGYKETDFGLLPYNWEILELHEFVEPCLRKTDKPRKIYQSIGIRSHGKGTFPKSDCNPKKIAHKTLYEVKSEDLITNITFAWEGAIAIVKEEDDAALVSHRFPTYVFDKSNIEKFAAIY